MASTWSALKIELLETGANSGTWGTLTNVNLGDAVLGEAITGSATVDFATDADVTITLTDSATTQSARNLRLNITESSTGVGSVRNLILGSGCQIEKFYLINNTGTGAKTVKNTSGTGISVPAGKATLVYNNGTNVVDAATYFTALTLGSALPVASGGTSLTTLTANNVILGNGASAPTFVAPSTSGNVLTSNGTTWSSTAPATSGTVTSVAMTVPSVLSISGSPITSSGTLALTYSGTALPVANGGTGLTAGTSGGVLAYTATGTLASSAALAASALVIGGGAGAAPSTTTTGTGVVTALGVNVGTAGAFVVNVGALGSPSTAGTMPAFTLGGTVAGGGNQINNVIIGTTTPLAGAFTTGTFTPSGITQPVTIGQHTGAPSYGVVSLNGSMTTTGVTGLAGGGGGDNNLYLKAPTGYSVLGSINNSTVTTTSSTGLAVTGTLSSTLGATIQGLTVGLGAGAVSTNTAVGSGTLGNNSTGAQNTAVGYQAGLLITSGDKNTAFGASIMDQGAGVTGQENAAFGRVNMRPLTSGSYNTALGNESLLKLTSGSNNTAVGFDALLETTTASNNTAVGYQAGYSQTTATSNAFLGYRAGYLVTAGNCTAIGHNAMGQAITTGGEHTAVGDNALTACTSGQFNVAVGRSSLSSTDSGSSNTGIGYQALASNTTGPQNTAVGYQAGYGITTGNEVVFVGNEAGKNISGQFNTAVGSYALTNYGGSAASGSGTNNIAFGKNASFYNTSGSYNVALGSGALQANTTASNNTAVGYQAGYTYAGTSGYNTLIGEKAGYALTGTNNAGYANVLIGAEAGIAMNSTTASQNIYNTFVGPFSGNAVTTGSKNTIIGAYTGNQGGLDIRTASNYIVLSDGDGNPRGVFTDTGLFALGTTTSVAGNTNARLVIKSSTIWDACEVQATTNGILGFDFRNASGTQAGSITINASSVAYNTSSDYRLKNTIAPMTGALAKVAQLKPVTYKWNADGSDGQGFIAHELAEVVPDCVTGAKDAVDANGKIKPQGIDVSFLVATLTAAIQEQQAIIESLKARLDAANL